MQTMASARTKSDHRGSHDPYMRCDASPQCERGLVPSRKNSSHMSVLEGARAVRAPRGTEISCLAWPQEAALRMLMNNLDPEVAERPDDLVVYGGNGRAARSWDDFDAIVRTLRRLEKDETLLVQSGKPVAVFQDAPAGAARPDRQRESRSEMGRLERLSRTRSPGTHDVRPDDGRLVDLHRFTRHRSRNVRDVCRVGAQALRRHARRAR